MTSNLQNEVERRIQRALNTTVTILNLAHLELEAIPESIEQLVNLKELSLHHNNLIIIPQKIEQLKDLTHLFVYNNQLKTIPKEVGQLTNLTYLSLAGNQLKTIPKEVGQLTNLTYLSLAGNQLKTIPKEVGQLTNLTYLSLAGNQLKTIPKEVGQLTNLTKLDLSVNSELTSPPPEIIHQGTHAILTYLRGQKDGEHQWISKMLVVGEGGVGKTSLLCALRGESFRAQQSTTHGIDIKALRLSHPSRTGISMTLNTWDFGGQEIYHATHQFFLTNRSLFLLAFNARLGYEQGKLIYWLKTIRANAPESPVILVATWVDERDADLPLSDLKQQFPQIVALWEVSNKTGQGIDDLRQTIINTAAELPLMGEIWPATWLEFATKVRATKAKQATTEQFWAAMGKYNVSDDGKPVLARWMHELGDILFLKTILSLMT